MPPTAAQRRVQEFLAARVAASSSSTCCVKDAEEIRKVFRHELGYSHAGYTLPLGKRAGVPEVAADVDLAGQLAAEDPEMAKMVLEPDALLLPESERQELSRQPHTHVGPDYDDFVQSTVRAGLQQLYPLKRLGRLRGRPLIGGAFAVPKDDLEDRFISDLPVNQILDETKLPRPVFAYIPRMRSLKSTPQKVLRVSKRDARHYFHKLRIGKKWRRWLAHPVLSKKRSLAPVHRAVPMGFGPAAGFAQALTDVCTGRASLPPERRLLPSEPAPSALPIWGSIIDDIWAVEECEKQQTAGDIGPVWMQLVESEWNNAGVESHPKKSVNAAVNEEVQGYHIGGVSHVVGVAVSKRLDLLQAALHILFDRYRVAVYWVERLVGKFGYCHSARAPLRSIFEATYRWLEAMRQTGRGYAVRKEQLPGEVFFEILFAAVTLPLAEFNLSTDFSTRVEATDSSMTGLGRSWTTMPSDLVQRCCRQSDQKGLYTNLSMTGGVEVVDGRCELTEVDIEPADFKWRDASMRAFPEHITLGEGDAANWGLEERLKRPAEFACRFLHLLDSAALTGALRKGRSPSRKLNMRCRKAGAIQLAGGLEGFWGWFRSERNPADRPSRIYEPAHRAKPEEPQPREKKKSLPASQVVERCLSGHAGSELVFVHFCSGPRRPGDLSEAVEQRALASGIVIVALALDPVIDSSHDLLKEHGMVRVIKLARARRIAGAHGGPPCATFSRSRHRRLPGGGGPRPLRTRSDVWQPKSGLSSKERMSALVGSLLALLVIGLLGEFACYGATVSLEHPADPAAEPYPSIFCTPEFAYFRSFCSLLYGILDQCMFGAETKKPTGLGITNRNGRAASLLQRCCHTYRHKSVIGADRNNPGVFATAALARYPSGLNECLAAAHVDQWCDSLRGTGEVFGPVLGQGNPAALPWRAEGVSTPQCAEEDGARGFWQWPQPCRGFLARHFESLHSATIRGGVGGPRD